MYGIQRSGWISTGENIVVVGSGHIGLHAAQLSKACGAGKVIITGTRESRLKYTRELEIEYIINIRKKICFRELKI